MTLLEQIEQQVLGRKLIRENEAVLVAVSGGLDSMVLLRLLSQLAGKYSWKIAVAHFNHQLRGRASDADERLVRQTCQKMRWPCETGTANVKEYAKENKVSLEMAARKLRHEFFAQVAAKRKIQTIALAHHADDQVELFFLRLLRGAGGEGLAGMKWRSPSPADARIKLVRPLLNQSKSTLATYAEEQRLAFREDATNASLDFQRNKIRHQLIPLLQKEFQPALMTTLLRTMEIVGDESALVGETARAWLENKETPFQKLPVALQRRVLLEQLLQKGVSPDAQLIELLRSSPGQIFNASDHLSVFRDEGGEVKGRTCEATSFENKSITVDTTARGSIALGQWVFSWKRAGVSGDKFVRKLGTEYFDAARVGEKVTLRYWQRGDRFQPIGMRASLKLQDLFVNAKIPRAERHRKVVAVAENGEIFWVEGVRISEKFKLTPSSKGRLAWAWSLGKRTDLQAT